MIDKTIEAIEELPNTDYVHCYDYEICTDDLKALAAELKQLRNIIAFYEIEIMPDGSFTSPRITQNEVDVKQLREFVGDIYTCRIGAGQGRWLNGEFTFFGKDAEVATGTDPFDAWQNLEGESK